MSNVQIIEFNFSSVVFKADTALVLNNATTRVKRDLAYTLVSKKPETKQ